MIDTKYPEFLTIVKINFHMGSGKSQAIKSLKPDIPLKAFYRLKTEARRLLLAHGLPFMDGFAVPTNKVAEIRHTLSAISVEFNTLKECFTSDYDYAVKQSISFEYRVVRVGPESTNEVSLLDWKNDIENLGKRFFSEIVEVARKFFIEKLAYRTECAVTTRKTLRNIRDKVDGLSFLNNALSPLVALLNCTLHGYEQKQNIRNRNIVSPLFDEVMAAVLIMCNQRTIEEYANGDLMLSKHGSSDMFQSDLLDKLVFSL